MCTFERRTYFSATETVNAVRDELLRTTNQYGVEILAYCFMPDHLHILAEGLTPDSEVEKCTAMFRQRTGYAHRQMHENRLWQDGYYDHILREEEITLVVARYIVANPVRGGLCEDVRRYPFVGSSRYSIDELAAAVMWQP